MTTAWSRHIDAGDISGALAMRRSGFTDADIERLLGYLPPLDMTMDEVRAALARQHEARSRSGSGSETEIQFLGDL